MGLSDPLAGAKGRVEEIVGDYGLGERNERGDLMVQFCNERNLMVTNTWFQLNNKFQDSLRLETTENLWQLFENVMHEVQENELGTQKRRAKQKWMTEEILALMDKRRVYKHIDNNKYREIHK